MVSIFKFFACSGFILCVLIKEMSDHEIKRFQHLKFFACSRIIICVQNLKNSDPEIKWFQPFKIVCLWQAQVVWEIFLSNKVLSELGEDCNVGVGFRVVEDWRSPSSQLLYRNYYWALQPKAVPKGYCACSEAVPSELHYRKILTEIFSEKFCYPKKIFFCTHALHQSI